MENCYENKCSCGRIYYGDKLQPFCASCYEIKLRTSEQERDQYKAELDRNDRILRSSAPEEYKNCASSIGAIQNYIVDMEQELESIRAQLQESARLALEWQSMENEKHIELEALRVEIERLVSLNDKLIESERKLINENLSIRAKIKEAHEPISKVSVFIDGSGNGGELRNSSNDTLKLTLR